MSVLKSILNGNKQFLKESDSVKAIVKLEVPEWQIGEEVSVHFPDSMVSHGVCEKDAAPRDCKRCKHRVENSKGFYSCEVWDCEFEPIIRWEE